MSNSSFSGKGAYFLIWLFGVYLHVLIPFPLTLINQSVTRHTLKQTSWKSVALVAISIRLAKYRRLMNGSLIERAAVGLVTISPLDQSPTVQTATLEISYRNALTTQPFRRALVVGASRRLKKQQIRSQVSWVWDLRKRSAKKPSRASTATVDRGAVYNSQFAKLEESGCQFQGPGALPAAS